MECPKCHGIISDTAESCPYCHKVFTLVCPNCRTKGTSPVCENCGYIILEKCSKCGKTVDTSREKCRCGFPVKTSIAYQECETDEFASIIVKFSALSSIRRVLSSQELYKKFKYRLKNLLTSQLKSHSGNIITYGDTCVINFNKELSFATSAAKAVKLALKIINTFSELNLKVQEELGTPIKLNLTIIKKSSEELLQNISAENNVKILNIKKDEQKFLKGMQVILDQYVQDCVSKDYNTDSLFAVENSGKSLMFYEILLEKYVLPPNKKSDENELTPAPKKIEKTDDTKEKDDIYSFKVFDISAKCKFEKSTANDVLKLLDSNKIITIRSDNDLRVSTQEILNYYRNKGLKVLYALCSEETKYTPWSVFEQLFRDFYGLSRFNGLIPQNFDAKQFNNIKNLILGLSRKASSPEDARFAYMEDFGYFLKALKNCTVIIDGFEYADDTTLQTLELYFDKFQNININFVFITDKTVSVHSKIHGLLRTPVYTEITLTKTNMDAMLSNIKDDASDFIQSFYYEKIKENYNGSKLYFDNALKFLTEKDVLISFDGNLIIKNNDSVLLPPSFAGLERARLKALSKNAEASMILAYSLYLGPRLDFKLLELLGIKEVKKNAEILQNAGLAVTDKDIIYICDYNLLKPVIQASLKKEAEQFLTKNILSKLKGLDSSATFMLMGKLGMYREEYLVLWKNSQFAMSTGDYDAYLNNCLGCLSLVEHIQGIPQEDIESNKLEVFQNILMSLYSYSPEKIYSIENILLVDAMKENDNDKIVKLSNLMLQGALISSNYTDARSLLHNILTRMKNPTLFVDGEVNIKFLLLSLVNIEILFNIGDYDECIEVAEDLLKVIKPEILDEIKPVNFSLNSFVGHILDTFRLAGFAKLITCAPDLEEFLSKINEATNCELPEKDCILAIKEFLEGKDYVPSDIDNSTAFSKVIYLILQEFSEHFDDYKLFAQNIYQAKLLASDIHEKQLELLCDLLIAYSYSKIGIEEKAASIYDDVKNYSEKSAIYNIVMIANYLIAKLKIQKNEQEEALMIINDALAVLQNGNNRAVVFYAMFEKLFIDLAEAEEIEEIDIDSEKQKLLMLSGLSRLTE